jgi:spore coat protein U-like protein
LTIRKIPAGPRKPRRHQTREEKGMKKVLMVMVAVALVAMAGVSWAASTTNLTVNATVVGTCKFSGTEPTLAFGDLDPTLDTEKTATVDVEFWCTKGYVPEPTFAATDGIGLGETRYMTRSGPPPADTIPYTIDSFILDGGTNQGPSGIRRNVTIRGTVPAGSYSDKTSGDYSNTVTIGINP